MAKWSGLIGYVLTEEIERGVWSDAAPTERLHYGDLISNKTRQQQSSDSTNSNIIYNDSISIIGNSFAMSHYPSMKYVIIDNCKWKVTDVRTERPRIIIQIGGIYNG